MKRLVLFLAALAGIAAPAGACTERAMLNLIGALEAPGGYNTVYRRSAVDPPRPLTTMTVGEVLDWQRRSLRAGSVSSAAGRYQIIRPTLRRMVDEGVVSASQRFRPGVQDRIARRLLRERGYKRGETSPAVANRIAGVWAALPQIGGPEAGSSVYEGIAGNHALIRADTYAGYLACRATLEEVQIESAAVRAGLRFGFSWERLLEHIATEMDRIALAAARAGTTLLFVLLGVDLVLRFGRMAATGDSLRDVLGGMLLRMFPVAMCYALLAWPGEIIRAVADMAAGIAVRAGADGGFAFGSWIQARNLTNVSLLEGVSHLGWVSDLWFPQRILIEGVFLLLSLILAVQAGLILWAYARLFVAAAAGIVTAGFGGLQQTMGVARRLAFSLLAGGLGLLALLLVLMTATELAAEVRSVANPIEAALALLLLDSVALILMFALPGVIAGLAKK